jgi:hypothetical protein
VAHTNHVKRWARTCPTTQQPKGDANLAKSNSKGAQATPPFASHNTPAMPPWRIELAKKFVVGDRLAHEKFARFMVLVFCNNPAS